MITRSIDGYTATAIIDLKDHEPLTLRGDWKAISEARKRFGKEWAQKLGAGLTDRDPEVLSEFVEVFSHGTITKDEVMDLSPPMRLVSDVLYELLMTARFGPDWQAELKKLEEEEGAKGAVPFGILTLLNRLYTRPSVPGSASQSSGAPLPGSPVASSSTPARNGSGRH